LAQEDDTNQIQTNREFYYIQMEKFARDAVADERIQCKEDIVVSERLVPRAEEASAPL